MDVAWCQRNLPDDASLLLPDGSDQGRWHRLQGHWRGDRNVMPHVIARIAVLEFQPEGIDVADGSL
jgi:hypothetical protein